MHYRNILALLHDIGAAILAWCLSYWLRFNMDIPSNFLQGMLVTLPVVIPIQTLVLWKFGLYQGIWRYASVSDLKRILSATLIAALTVVAVVAMASWQEKVPRSVLILDPLLLAVIMGGSRFAYRAWKEHTLYGSSQSRGEPVLVLGAGDAAVSLLKETRRSEEWRIVGLLDDDPQKRGRVIDGVRVLGRMDQIALFAKPLQARYAIVALPSATAPTRRRAVEAATNAGLQVLTVPSFDDLLSGKVTVSQLRRVELDDLLGREAVTLDSDGLSHLLADHTVMVTGAGGSIGSELCRQIARFKPRQLVLFELNEFALYRVEQEFHEQFPEIRVICAIGDVKNPVRVQQVFDTYKPTVVFHAAAYKHVPLMEQANAAQAVLNNALGTYRLASAAITAGIEKFVLISTDKAVNPTNVMGASKRLSELICQMLQRKSRTQFVIVRFGNVLGSTGSVIPKFREQLARGGPITVTHPEITRYFMSISEAAQLVLQAGLMGEGGNIFVLDMGEPVKIVDLARDLIRLSGLSKDDIKIVYTGLRPGEKLYEELLADDEHTLPTPHPKLRIAKPKMDIPDQLEAIVTWLEQSEAHPEETVRSGLRIWVPGVRERRANRIPARAMSHQLAAKAGATAAAASVGRWATCLLGFTIPVSVVLDNTFMAVAALGWLLGAQWTTARDVISANRVAVAALILFGLLLLGLSHGVGTFGDLGKYVDLLLLPAYLTFFQDERIRERGLQLFCIASMAAVIVSYMAYLGWLKHDFWLVRDPSYVTGFKSSITHSLIVGFAAFIFLLRARAEPNMRRRIFYIVLMLIAAHNVIFMISSRTGYIVIGILFLYFFAVSFGRRGVFLMMAAAAIIFVAAYSASTIFHQRLDAAVHEFEGWKAGTASDTSIGLRLEFYQHALGVIREHPWVGWGTGSFPAAYASTITDPNMIRTGNPHDEYLLIGAQIGVLGIVSLIYLFYSQWWLSGRLIEAFYRDLGRGLVLLFAVGCLFNSLLLDHTEGLMFAWLSGLIFSAPRRTSEPPRP